MTLVPLDSGRPKKPLRLAIRPGLAEGMNRAKPDVWVIELQFREGTFPISKR
jgi:hypothetical protein